MKMLVALVFGMVLIAKAAHAGMETKEIKYKVGDQEFVGFLAYDDKNENKRPGILIVHEWWGHNDYSRQRAKQLAELGYTTLALDMYGDGKNAKHPEEAGQMASAVRSNMDEAAKRFNVALELLKKQKTVDGEKVAAIGYCFGGGIVLEMARRGADVNAVVSFHGSLGTSHPAETGSVSAKVLVLNGASDPMVKPEDIEKFKSEMTSAGVDYKFVNYPDAQHAFTNPEADKLGKEFKLPLAYNKDADKKSWEEMLALFQREFN